MNRGLLLKAVREAGGATLLFGAGLFLFEAIIAFVLPSFFSETAGRILSNPFSRNLLQALLGTEVPVTLGPLAFRSIAWVHPVALALIWAHEILFCTRLPVREIDRGTVDVVLALPVSRWQAWITESSVWLTSGAILLALALAGAQVGGTMIAAQPAPEITEPLAVVANLFCLYLAVGGLAYLVSACSDRRGLAIGLVFAVVLASFFLQFLTQFWEVARTISFLGVLHSYQPFATLESGTWPWSDMAVLGVAGLAFWLAGGIVFARRDISTV